MSTLAKGTLADRFRDPKNVEPSLDDPFVRQAMMRAERMVLDDAAARLAMQLTAVSPRECRRMFDQVMRPEKPLWIEFLAMAVIDERERLSGGEDLPPFRPGGYKERTPDMRTAMLINPNKDNPLDLEVWCIEDGEFSDVGYRVGVWPSAAIIRHKAEVIKEDGDFQEVIWGYLEGYDVRPLAGCGNMVARKNERNEALTQDEIMQSMIDLSGWARFALGVLAMLQTVTIASEPVRPPGHVRLGGRMLPPLTTRHLTLKIPHRVRNVVAYARKRLAEEALHRKRLHEVREHFRHLDHQPRTPGWSPILIDGQMYWRKRIAGHLRGDPALGVVEHDVTIVHGPRESAA